MVIKQYRINPKVKRGFSLGEMGLFKAKRFLRIWEFTEMLFNYLSHGGINICLEGDPVHTCPMILWSLIYFSLPVLQLCCYIKQDSNNKRTWRLSIQDFSIFCFTIKSYGVQRQFT